MANSRVQVQDMKIRPRVHGNKVDSIEYRWERGFKTREIKKIFDDSVKQLNEGNHQGEIAVLALVSRQNGKPAAWRYLTKFSDVKKGLSLVFDEDVDEYFNSKGFDLNATIPVFSIQITTKNAAAGGCGDNNDCLYKCLVELVPSHVKKVFPKPEDLKKFCDLERKDKIPLEKIEDIEKKLGCSIQVSGEYKHKSVTKTHNVFLTLDNEHYQVDYRSNNIKVGGLALEEKEVAIFKYQEKDRKTVRLCTRKENLTISLDELQQWFNKPRSAPYIFVKSNGGDMREQLKQYRKDARFISDNTGGEINLFKCGSINKIIKNRIIELNKTLCPDMIDEEEAEWISECHRCGMIWGKHGYEGKGYAYDFTSEYPSIMVHPRFQFPIKKGKYLKLTQKEFDKQKYYQYGIYRAIIHDVDYRLLLNKKKYFTHIELTRAKELGYKIEIVQDKRPNFLLYEKETLVSGKQVFDKYITPIFKLKKEYGKEYPILKTLITKLWGLLCEKTKFKKTLTDGEEYSVRSDHKLCGLVPVETDLDKIKKWIITTQPKTDMYVTGFARLAPFLTAYCRDKMSRLFTDIAGGPDNIVRVHTDGFISKKKLKIESGRKRNKITDVVMGNDLGELKFEKEGHVTVKNALSVTWK